MRHCAKCFALFAKIDGRYQRILSSTFSSTKLGAKAYQSLLLALCMKGVSFRWRRVPDNSWDQKHSDRGMALLRGEEG